MKKRIVFTSLLIFCSLYLISCGTTPPEKYFNIAVLNTNILAGFANTGMLRQLDSPSEKLTDNNETVPMKRAEIINDKTKTVEENFGKIKDLKETDETKEMLQASVALYEFVLPVFKNEYTQLAASFDNGAPENITDTEAQAIHDKYFSKYDELYKNLISAGKAYAEKNNIKVNWGEN